MRLSIILIVVACTGLSACTAPEPATGNAPAVSAKPAPPPPPVPEASRKPAAFAQTVRIPPGATSLVVKGTLAANKDAEYVIGEEQGSVFMAHAMTPKEDLDVSVYRSDTGERIADEQPSNPWFFMARLPETLGYLVAVRGRGVETPYSLEIEVPRKIVFDEKTGAAEISVQLPANGVLSYLTPPGATITAELTKAPQDSYLTVHGLAGQALLKAEQSGRTFSGAAPKPNEELVVIINQGATDGDVTLKVQRKS